jgi:EmrB/QacA subfamily drug resistance transporter
MSDESGIRLGTPVARGVILATVLGSGISFLDGLIINVALPHIDKDIGLGVAGFQWTVSGYLLTLSSLLLLGGALGDLFGRRRVYLAGLLVFIASSMACAVAPTSEVLVIARMIQGVGGALMVPASLAIIQAVFVEEDRGAAIGAWTGYGTVFTALGPFVGGFFVTYLSWRWAFFINLPLGIAAWIATLRYVPETRAESGSHRIDYVGALLACLSLGGLTYWAIEGPAAGSDHMPMLIGLSSLALLVAFLVWESRTAHPMLPLSLFRSSQFNWINLCTLLLYGAFVGGSTFVQIQLQVDLGYSALEASLGTLPVSAMMIVLSQRFGAIGQRIGPKLPMAAGSLLIALSLAWMAGIHDGRPYLTFVLPAILLWGLGLSMVVAPLTSAALAAADQRHIGVASALNNAASRVGASFAIALLPALAGMAAGEPLDGPSFQDGYPRALYISAAVCAVSALVALAFVRGNSHTSKAS